MVNRGGPSKACQECRRRKIRCHLQRPECSQCRRAGKSCPGYRNLDNIIFRHYRSTEGDDSSRSEASASEPCASISTAQREDLRTPGVGSGGIVDFPSDDPSQAASFATWPGSYGSGSAGRPSLSPSRALGPPSWEHQAISCFIAQYTFGTPSPSSLLGWFDFLPDQFIQSSDSSPLRPTVIAISYASLAGQSTLRWLGTEARKHYGCALSKINDALKSEKTAVEDDVLCSIILAGFYENIVGDNLHVLGSHRTGLSLLLKMRGPAQLQTIRGRSLFRHACSMYRIFNYNTGSQPLSLIQDYRLQKNNEAGDFENHFVYGNLAEQTDRIAAYCADFKAFYTSSQQLSPEERVAGLTSFLDQAETQRTELNLCMETIMHKNWRGFRHDFMPGITTHETPQQPPYIVTYADMSRTPTANLSRTCLMFLGEIAYLCHSGLEDPLAPLFPDPALASSPTTKACIASVRGLIDEVNASIPFMVDDVDASANITADQAPKSGIKAFVSIWSLWIVKSSALAERAQVAYAEQGLAKIAGLWGICLAAHVGGLKRYDRYGVVHRGKW